MVTHNVRLRSPLDRGGMGSVWTAYHQGLDVEVAVKFIGDSWAHDSTLLKRFKREAAAAAKIRSPHVVQMLDHGVSPDGVPYIVMELLEGEDLRHRLDRDGVLERRKLALLMRQTAEVLDTAHGIGIVHRDIKPGNLFLMQTRQELFVKVLDFGIARQLHAGVGKYLTDTGAMLGTPVYMSPEHVMSAEVDRTADLWSLAVVAYEALTGRVPFDGETVGAVIHSIMEGSYPAPCQLAAELPTAVDAWFETALHPEVERRFPSAEIMAATLADALGEAGSHLPQMGPASSGVRAAGHRAEPHPAPRAAPGPGAGSPGSKGTVASRPVASAEPDHASARRPARSRAGASLLGALAGAAAVLLLAGAGYWALGRARPPEPSHRAAATTDSSATETASSATETAAPSLVDSTGSSASAGSAAEPLADAATSSSSPPSPSTTSDRAASAASTRASTRAPAPSGSPGRPAWCEDPNRAFEKVVGSDGKMMVKLKPQCR